MKSKVLRLLIDMDAVTADIFKLWLSLINKETGENLTTSDIKDWDIASSTKMGKKCYNFLSQPNFFFDLKPIPKAIDTLKKLHDDGHDIVFVTACPPTSETAFYEKLSWVKKYLPFIDAERNVIAAYRKDLIKGDVLFDDKYDNLIDFSGIAVCMSYEYNKKYEGPRVTNWTAFYHFIQTLIGKE